MAQRNGTQDLSGNVSAATQQLLIKLEEDLPTIVSAAQLTRALLRCCRVLLFKSWPVCCAQGTEFCSFKMTVGHLSAHHVHSRTAVLP
jgi:hypothetical protein